MTELRQRVTFLDGPCAGEVHEIPSGEASAWNVGIERNPAFLDPDLDEGPATLAPNYVTHRLTRWNGVTYGHVAPLRLVGDRRAILKAELLAFPGVLEEIYQSLEEQVLKQPGVVASTLIRFRRDDEATQTSTLGAEALACP